MDQLLRWLARIREIDANARLVDLLGDALPETDVLVELIAVDLIRGWRSGERPGVEDYLMQFPNRTFSAASTLDLIDTELCIRRETGASPSLEMLQNRFPGLKQELGELYFLDEPSQINPARESPPRDAYPASNLSPQNHGRGPGSPLVISANSSAPDLPPLNRNRSSPAPIDHSAATWTAPDWVRPDQTPRAQGYPDTGPRGLDRRHDSDQSAALDDGRALHRNPTGFRKPSVVGQRSRCGTG